MGFETAGRFDDGGKAALSISCSICLRDITNYRDRAFAELQCGHQFHLDCIGCVFNMKGVMQCPNCGKIEKGQWLYADSSRLFAPLNVDDSFNHEDVYDLNCPESSVWCLFGEFSHIAGAVAIDEVDHLPSPTKPDVDHLPSPTRTSVDHLPSPTRTNVDMLTSGSYVHPFLAGQSSSTPGPSSVSSVTNHPHLDSSARAWEQSQALEAYYEQSSAHRSNTQVHVGSSSDHTHGGCYPSSSRSFHDADNSVLHPFHHVVEREPPHPHPYPHETGPFHQTEQFS